MPRSINAAGLALIKSFEGFSSYPYRDSAGVWTIGYGHTKEVSTWSSPVTEEEAEDLLRADLADAEADVETQITAPLNDNQFAALVSLVFNVGTAPLTRTLGTLLNSGDYTGAAGEFLKWDHAGGQVNAGLSRRRVAERELFLS
jgi:lysozyme